MELMSTVVERRPGGAFWSGGLMELIAVPVRAALLADSSGSGEFVVSHSDTSLTRGLELDEQVVVVDPDGEFHAARVVDLEFGLEDTHYVLELGVRLPPENVRDRLNDAPADPSEDLGTLLDLLGRLRDHPDLQ